MTQSGATVINDSPFVPYLDAHTGNEGFWGRSGIFSQSLLHLLDLQCPPFLCSYNSTAGTVFNRCTTSVIWQLALWPLSERFAGKENIAHA
jgi:hypothetical protein